MDMVQNSECFEHLKQNEKDHHVRDSLKKIDKLNEYFKENKIENIIKKFKRLLKKDGIESIRQAATNEKHGAIYCYSNLGESQYNKVKNKYLKFEDIEIILFDNLFFYCGNDVGSYLNKFDKMSESLTLKEVNLLLEYYLKEERIYNNVFNYINDNKKRIYQKFLHNGYANFENTLNLIIIYKFMIANYIEDNF